MADGFVGAAWCSHCHTVEAAQWRTTPHARAADALTPAERANPRCMACHGTGGAPGVGCEACHGPGADYWPEPVMANGKRAQAAGLLAGDTGCERCHTAGPGLRPFDRAAALPSVRHRAPIQGTQTDGEEG